MNRSGPNTSSIDRSSLTVLQLLLALIVGVMLIAYAVGEGVWTLAVAPIGIAVCVTLGYKLDEIASTRSAPTGPTERLRMVPIGAASLGLGAIGFLMLLVL